MKLTFLGTGTSQGIPVIGCKCEVCTSEDSKDKRLRTSAMVEVNGTRIVFDAGPDFRQQMLRTEVDQLDAVVFTHEHKDHVAGLDDVRPFNYMTKKDFQIYCTERVFETLKREYRYVFDDSFTYPGIPKVNPNFITNAAFEVKGVELMPIQVWHHKMPVFGYRIGDMAYITDANRIDEEEKQKLQGLKVLVLNALRITEHISHFSLEQALALAKELKAEQVFFTHASHLLGKHEEISTELPENVKLAFDGLTVEIR
ncbi:MAG: phosphoribosyl 1,2-cyclic phosphate phosphodiesterase [Parvicellaceae bacterium]|jgi:phosphoribosyl 1,2-cyclic phosphate phosphodiesterase